MQEAKEESQKSKSLLQHKEKQFVHEMRKKEKEFERVREQLQMNLKERTKDKKAMGFTVLNGNTIKLSEQPVMPYFNLRNLLMPSQSS